MAKNQRWRHPPVRIAWPIVQDKARTVCDSYSVCPLNWATRSPELWLNIILDVSLWGFLVESHIWGGKLSKADCCSQPVCYTSGNSTRDFRVAVCTTMWISSSLFLLVHEVFLLQPPTQFSLLLDAWWTHSQNYTLIHMSVFVISLHHCSYILSHKIRLGIFKFCSF
jgi:hypothetical protein